MARRYVHGVSEPVSGGIAGRIRFPVLIIADGVDLEGFDTVEGVEGAVESPDVDDVEDSTQPDAGCG